MTAINVRHRTQPLRAICWTGQNEAEVESLCANFQVLDEPCDEDPEATAQMCANPHRVWTLVYTGDWIVERIGGGFERVRAEDFEERYEEVPDGA